MKKHLQKCNEAKAKKASEKQKSTDVIPKDINTDIIKREPEDSLTIKEEPEDSLTIKKEPEDSLTIKEEPIDCNDCGICDTCNTIHDVVMSIGP